LLDSALASAFQTFGGTELFPSTAAKIARIAYGLVSNHTFVDGNKRIGTYGGFESPPDVLLCVLFKNDSISESC